MDYWPLEVDAYTNPTLAPIGESPMAQSNMPVKELSEFESHRWQQVAYTAASLVLSVIAVELATQQL